MSLDPSNVPGLGNNLVLRQLAGLRREMTAVLDNQRRERELNLRLSQQVADGFEELRKELRAIKSDVVLLENGLLSRHNEILAVLARLDELSLSLPEDDGGTSQDGGAV